MAPMTKQRIVVGLSGGVDSAVTAYLLKQQGHEVVGIFMKNWEDDDDSEYCSSNVDFVDAAAVAQFASSTSFAMAWCMDWPEGARVPRVNPATGVITGGGL